MIDDKYNVAKLRIKLFEEMVEHINESIPIPKDGNVNDRPLRDFYS